VDLLGWGKDPVTLSLMYTFLKMNVKPESYLYAQCALF
jgi:hypothetical protein